MAMLVGIGLMFLAAVLFIGYMIFSGGTGTLLGITALIGFIGYAIAEFNKF